MDATAQTPGIPQTTATEVSSAPPETQSAPPAAPEPSKSSKILEKIDREAKFAQREVEYKTKLAEMEDELKVLQGFKVSKEDIAKNPAAFLEKYGISYDELTESVVKYYKEIDQQAKPLSAEEIRKEIESEFQAREVQKQAQADARVIQDFQSEISEFIGQNEDTYPHLTNLGDQPPQELLYDLINAHFEETGKFLNIQEAAEAAEAHFRDEFQTLQSKLSKEKGTPPKAEEGSSKASADKVESKEPPTVLTPSRAVRDESKGVSFERMKSTETLPPSQQGKIRKIDEPWRAQRQSFVDAAIAKIKD